MFRNKERSLGNVKTCQIEGKLSRIFRNFPGYLETFQAIWKCCRLPGRFPGLLEIFQAIWKPSRSSGKFQAISKLSRPSGKFPQAIKKISSNLEILQDFGKYFRLFENFPDSQCGPISMLQCIALQ